MQSTANLNTVCGIQQRSHFLRVVGRCRNTHDSRLLSADGTVHGDLVDGSQAIKQLLRQLTFVLTNAGRRFVAAHNCPARAQRFRRHCDYPIRSGPVAILVAYRFRSAFRSHPSELAVTSSPFPVQGTECRCRGDPEVLCVRARQANRHGRRRLETEHALTIEPHRQRTRILVPLQPVQSRRSVGWRRSRSMRARRRSSACSEEPRANLVDIDNSVGTTGDTRDADMVRFFQMAQRPQARNCVPSPS